MHRVDQYRANCVDLEKCSDMRMHLRKSPLTLPRVFEDDPVNVQSSPVRERTFRSCDVRTSGHLTARRRLRKSRSMCVVCDVPSEEHQIWRSTVIWRSCRSVLKTLQPTLSIFQVLSDRRSVASRFWALLFPDASFAEDFLICSTGGKGTVFLCRSFLLIVLKYLVTRSCL